MYYNRDLNSKNKNKKYATNLPDFSKLLLTLLFNLCEQVSLGADLPRGEAESRRGLKLHSYQSWSHPLGWLPNVHDGGEEALWGLFWGHLFIFGLRTAAFPIDSGPPHACWTTWDS